MEAEIEAILAEVKADPVACNAELTPEKSEEIWIKIQKEIRKIKAKK